MTSGLLAVFKRGGVMKMTNIEKFLLLSCMSILIISCIWDILTLNELGWDLTHEYVMLLVSSAMCYLTVTDKI